MQSEGNYTQQHRSRALTHIELQNPEDLPYLVISTLYYSDFTISARPRRQWRHFELCHMHTASLGERIGIIVTVIALILLETRQNVTVEMYMSQNLVDELCKQNLCVSTAV